MLEKNFHFFLIVFLFNILKFFPCFQGSEKVRDISLPEELVFTVDDKILNDINQAKAQFLKQVDFLNFFFLDTKAFLSTTTYKNWVII